MQQLSDELSLIQSAAEKDQRDLKFSTIRTYNLIRGLEYKGCPGPFYQTNKLIQYGREFHRLIDTVIEKYEKRSMSFES